MLYCDTTACPRVATFTLLGSHYCAACWPRLVRRVFAYLNPL